MQVLKSQLNLLRQKVDVIIHSLLKNIASPRNIYTRLPNAQEIRELQKPNTSGQMETFFEYKRPLKCQQWRHAYALKSSAKLWQKAGTLRLIKRWMNLSFLLCVCQKMQFPDLFRNVIKVQLHCSKIRHESEMNKMHFPQHWKEGGKSWGFVNFRNDQSEILDAKKPFSGI